MPSWRLSVVNTLVLLYNVQMKRMESKGEIERVERIDLFDRAYPLSYLSRSPGGVAVPAADVAHLRELR